MPGERTKYHYPLGWIKHMLTITVILLLGSYILICGLLYVQQERLLFFPDRLAADFRFTFAVPFDEVTWPVGGPTLAVTNPSRAVFIR